MTAWKDLSPSLQPPSISALPTCSPHPLPLFHGSKQQAIWRIQGCQQTLGHRLEPSLGLVPT